MSDGHGPPFNRRPVRAVGLIDVSALSHPLWDAHAVHDLLLAHHADHPELPLRVVMPADAYALMRTRLNGVMPSLYTNPHDLIDDLGGWLGVAALWSPLPTRTGPTEDSKRHYLADALCRWANADRRFWRAHGREPWTAAVYVHHRRPAHAGMLARWEVQQAEAGDRAGLLDVEWEPGTAAELLPAVREFLDLLVDDVRKDEF